MDRFKLIYTSSKGDEIELYSEPYKLQEVVGLGDVDGIIQTQQIPFFDGSDYIDALLQPRYLDIVLQIRATNHVELEERRRYLAKVFNPKNGLGTLRYVSESSERVIQCVSLSVPKYPDGTAERSDTLQRATIQLEAPDPYWRSLVINTDEISSFTALFEFQFEGEFELGLEGAATVIQNPGDTPIPFIARIYGPTINPRITNETTGEFIQVSAQLFEGDVMEINTENKQITVNGVDAFQYIDIESQFFSLGFSESVLKYTSDVGVDEATLDIIYQERYNSV